MSAGGSSSAPSDVERDRIRGEINLLLIHGFIYFDSGRGFVLFRYGRAPATRSRAKSTPPRKSA